MGNKRSQTGWNIRERHGTIARTRFLAQPLPMSVILRAVGPSILVARFDPAQTCMLRSEQIQQLAYHVARVLTGQGSAVSEWEYFGIEVEVEPDSDQGDEPPGR